MNKNVIKILEYLIDNYGLIDIDKMAGVLGINRRMINYYLNQINILLKEHNIPEISFSGDSIAVSFELSERYKELIGGLSFHSYFLSAKERQNCIILKIALSKKRQIIDELAIELNVSRSSLINDLLEIKEYLKLYDVDLLNSRHKGYFLSGDELKIRYIIYTAFHSNDNKYIKKFKIDMIERAQEEVVFGKVYSLITRNIEKTKDNFTYYSLREIAETISLALIRSRTGALDPINEEIDETTVAQVKEIFGSCSYYDQLDVNEIYYLYIIFKAVKINRFGKIGTDAVVLAMADYIIDQFDKVTGIDLRDYAEIFNMFMLHLYSMYYRSKYMVKINCCEENNEEGYHYICERIMAEVEDRYNLFIDADEKRYINYYLSCVGMNDNSFHGKRDKIIISCAFGIGSSLYIRFQLNSLLGNRYNIEITDVKNLTDIIDQNTKLIISTLALDKNSYNVPTIKVSTILSNENKDEIINCLNISDNESYNYGIVNDIMNIISKHCNICNERELNIELLRYFDDTDSDEYTVKDLLSKEGISIVDGSDMRLSEAIVASGKRLIADGYIDHHYFDDVIMAIDKYGLYCECLEGILLVHGRCIETINKPMIELLICHPSLFADKFKKNIHCIILLVASDKNSHNRALREIITKMTNDNYFEQISNDGVDEIFERMTE